MLEERKPTEEQYHSNKMLGTEQAIEMGGLSDLESGSIVDDTSEIENVTDAAADKPQWMHVRRRQYQADCFTRFFSGVATGTIGGTYCITSTLVTTVANSLTIDETRTIGAPGLGGFIVFGFLGSILVPQMSCVEALEAIFSPDILINTIPWQLVVSISSLLGSIIFDENLNDSFSNASQTVEGSMIIVCFLTILGLVNQRLTRRDGYIEIPSNVDPVQANSMV